MMHRGPKGRSGPRSNMYSESRCSNWARFDPFDEEAEQVQQTLQPAAELPAGEGQSCQIYVAPLHPRFIQPATSDDVITVLTRVPRHFLEGLKTLLILGGTSKQDKLAEGDRFRYGCYGGGRICLSAFPRRLLVRRLRGLAKPSIMQEYERAGARYRFERGQWTLEFHGESLRRFYLDDVLLHELGHHVDRLNRDQQHQRCERFAKWFAETVAQPQRVEEMLACKRGDQL